MSIFLDDYREQPDYRVQKALAIEFWAEPWQPLPSGITGCCGVCLVKSYRGWMYSEPSAHHLIIPRNYTRDLDKTVNWWWNLVPVHELCHKEAHGKLMRARLARYLARQIGNGNEAVGLEWLKEQVILEELKFEVHLPAF